MSNGVLILDRITSADAGVYTCSARNSLLDIEVQVPQQFVIKVEEIPGPPKFLFAPANRTTVQRGETAILECPGVGSPIPKAVWSRPVNSIINNRTSVLRYGLQIVNAQPEDSDTYICRLDNGYSDTLTHEIRLDVLESPFITHGPVDTLTDEGDSLELNCVANGNPLPAIRWLINGDEIFNDGNIQVETNKLRIHSVEKKHAGIVQCFAKNEVGEVFESKLLQVIPKQISSSGNVQPFGTIPHVQRSNGYERGNDGSSGGGSSRRNKPGKGKKKMKNSKFIYRTQVLLHFLLTFFFSVLHKKIIISK